MYHFTVDGNAGVYGTRIPALFIRNGNKILLRVDGSPILVRDHIMPTFVAGTKFHVRFEQVYDSALSKYILKAYVNRVLYYQVENTDPREFQNVKIYTCDDWHGTCNGLFAIYGFKYGPLQDASET